MAVGGDNREGLRAQVSTRAAARHAACQPTAAAAAANAVCKAARTPRCLAIPLLAGCLPRCLVGNLESLKPASTTSSHSPTCILPIPTLPLFAGYLQRCLIKNLESLKVAYDCTVRDDCDASIVQVSMPRRARCDRGMLGMLGCWCIVHGPLQLPEWPCGLAETGHTRLAAPATRPPPLRPPSPPHQSLCLFLTVPQFLPPPSPPHQLLCYPFPRSFTTARTASTPCRRAASRPSPSSSTTRHRCVRFEGFVLLLRVSAEWVGWVGTLLGR